MDIKAAIRASADRPLRSVTCQSWATDEWDGTIYVRTMTGKERDEFEHIVSKATRKQDNRGLKIRLILLTCCTEAGDSLFTDDDAEWLANKSAVEINRLADAALSSNGFTDKDVAELEKN